MKYYAVTYWNQEQGAGVRRWFTCGTEAAAFMRALPAGACAALARRDTPNGHRCLAEFLNEVAALVLVDPRPPEFNNPASPPHTIREAQAVAHLTRAPGAGAILLRVE